MDYKDLYNLIYSTKSQKTGSDVDYAFVEKDDVIYLLFKGSNSDVDWKADFNFPAKLYKNQKSSFYAHRGFGDTWKTANDVIIPELIKRMNNHPSYQIIISGHSLGGAMAILASEDLCFRTGYRAKLITFGTPKTLFGNSSKEYFLSCVSSVRNFENRNDIVPTIPVSYTNLYSVKVGEKFNVIKMLKNIEYYHTQYGKINY